MERVRSVTYEKKMLLYGQFEIVYTIAFFTYQENLIFRYKKEKERYAMNIVLGGD